MARAGVIWLTGIPASGKTTIARGLLGEFRARGIQAEILDGDEVRRTISKGLSFSKADRDANVLRLAEMARLLARNGVWTLVAAVSPYREARKAARDLIEQEGLLFVEVHVRCSLAVAESRDPKGLYAKARRGEIADLTGLSAPYEEPEAPEASIDTERAGPEEAVRAVLAAAGFRAANPGAGGAL